MKKISLVWVLVCTLILVWCTHKQNLWENETAYNETLTIAWVWPEISMEPTVEERNKKIAEIWDTLSVGDVVEGKVMRFTDYGAFVDIGGIDGLLHISEISWGKLKHPQEVLEIGQVLNVKILSMNAEKGKISLGLKQNAPEPWSVIDEQYQVGQVINGKVVQLKEYGAFIELAPGLDGLVHISEIAYKRVNKVSDELTLGQEVEAKILEIDKEKKRISLSIKATLPEPEKTEEPAPAPAEEA